MAVADADLAIVARNAAQKYAGLARPDADRVLAALDLTQTARLAKVSTMMPESTREGFVRRLLEASGCLLPATRSQPAAPFVSCLCVTWLRPMLLGHMIRSFVEQDYPADCRELVILDDAGQYDHQRGDRWELVSVPRRFRTLGEKRNACAGLADRAAEIFCVWDDDDLYLPWAISACVAGASRAPLVRPSIVLGELGRGRLHTRPTGGLYHGSWAFRRDAFESVGGYRPIDSGEDQDLARRMAAAGISTADPIAAGATPYYVYRDNSGSYHISWLPGDGYGRLGIGPGEIRKSPVIVDWPYDLRAATIDGQPVRAGGAHVDR